MGRRVLRAHVDHDPLVGDLVALARPWVMESQSWPVTVKTRPSLVSAGPAYMSWSVSHQLYDLRSSGGGMEPPLYSTGMPPRG